MIYATRFCWNCGRWIAEGLLFCDNEGKCKKAYERKQRIQRRHDTKIGRRENYGLTGSINVD